MREMLLLFLAGGAGALARYALSYQAHQLLGQRFAWGTLAVNLAGCFAIGLLLPLIAAGLLWRDARIVLAVGFLGSFTTFSTFGWETLRFIEQARYGAAAANIGLSLGLGLLAVWAGAALGRSILSA